MSGFIFLAFTTWMFWCAIDSYQEGKKLAPAFFAAGGLYSALIAMESIA